jgi:hypothetical protein
VETPSRCTARVEDLAAGDPGRGQARPNDTAARFDGPIPVRAGFRHSVNNVISGVLDLTDEEAATLLRELDGIIDGDRYFLSPRIRTLQAIRAKVRPEPPKASHPSGEPVREPLPPSPKRYAPPRATAARRRGR